jgi:hypothetical protein
MTRGCSALLSLSFFYFLCDKSHTDFRLIESIFWLIDWIYIQLEALAPLNPQPSTLNLNPELEALTLIPGRRRSSPVERACPGKSLDARTGSPS